MNRQTASVELTANPHLSEAEWRERLLYGRDRTTHIVAVERAGDNAVTIYRRADGDRPTVQRVAFRPWLLAERAEPWAAIRPKSEITPLAGPHRYQFLVTFASWPSFLSAVQAGDDTGETFFRLRSPVEQYLVLSGQTLFKDMVFDDLRRLQLDIETLGLDPADERAEIIAVALHTSDGQEAFFAQTSTERDLIETAADWLLTYDPDVIEGHNIFNFDLPYLAARAQRYGLGLTWGRDGSPMRVGEGKQRFKAGALSLPFTPVYVSGRHVVDTYQQIQRYDVGGRLSSYALKRVMAALFPDQEREIIPGDEIRHVWEAGDIDRLAAYNLADVRDVDTLSRLTLPTEFYQSQLVPRPLQSVATGGPGEKINDLMLRAYLTDGHSVPSASPPRPYPGGHAELLESGAFAPVVKCDVESLYPSIMVVERIAAKTDILGASLPMLGELTQRRLHAKEQTRRTSGSERAIWDGLQSSFKVLINSFYGYLGYGGALFNDYDAAERVTLAGQTIIKRVVEELRARGSLPIEVDTDGVYFVPPDTVRTLADEFTYVESVASVLMDGIRLAHDGRYAAMLSLKLKNYALLEHDGAMVLKGSSLRSRRLERCFRAFLEDAAAGFMRDEREEVRNAYFALAARIRDRQLDVREFSQWGLLNEDTLAKQPRLKRLVTRHRIAARGGDRIETYERHDGSLALVEEYTNDESTPYLLRRLRDSAERFRPLFTTDAEFDAFFPAISSRTNMEAARVQEAREQLSLFG